MVAALILMLPSAGWMSGLRQKWEKKIKVTFPPLISHFFTLAQVEKTLASLCRKNRGVFVSMQLK